MSKIIAKEDLIYWRDYIVNGRIMKWYGMNFGEPVFPETCLSYDECETIEDYTRIGVAPRNVPETPTDPVKRPEHYVSHPSGIECIQITEHMGFNLGNAFKYIWRADLKDDAIQDLKKAVWYINRELGKRKNA